MKRKIVTKLYISDFEKIGFFRWNSNCSVICWVWTTSNWISLHFGSKNEDRRLRRIMTRQNWPCNHTFVILEKQCLSTETYFKPTRSFWDSNKGHAFFMGFHYHFCYNSLNSQELWSTPLVNFESTKFFEGVIE